MHFGLPLILALYCLTTMARAEVGVAPEPVGNATDRAVAEKKSKRAKKPTRELTADEKGHRLAHPHKRKGKKGAKS